MANQNTPSVPEQEQDSNTLRQIRLEKLRQRQADGNDRLVLWVVGFNTNAQGFYRHIGFHKTGLTQTEDMGPELEMINY